MIIKRAFNQRMLMLAAALTALLATTVLTSLAAYTSSVTGEGLRRSLTSPSFSEAGTRLTASVDIDTFASTDQAVRQALRDTYRDIPLTTTVSARGSSYQLPGRGDRQLAEVAMYDGIERHARLTAGRWPAAGALETVLPAPAAKALGVRPGGTIPLRDAATKRVIQIKLAGLFAVNNAADPIWRGNRLVTAGVQRFDYTTYGPVVLDPATFRAKFAEDASATWTVTGDLRELKASELNGVAQRVSGLKVEGKVQVGSATRLPDLLERLDKAVLASRSALLVPAIQLVVLAAYALLLIARLLAEHRSVETALLRARGGAAKQIARLALGDGLLLAVPAAILAPLLAPFVLRLVASAEVIEQAGLTLDTAPAMTLWKVAITSAAACAVLVVLPLTRGLRSTYTEARAARGRGGRLGTLQKAGGDLALLLLAGLGIWQLSHYGGPVSTDSTSDLGVDPVLVVGPALALTAGGVLTLRLIPLLSRLAERAIPGRRGLTSAFGVWQLSRRPLRHSGPVLLLVLALAIGVLSVVTGETWRESQRDQADFQTGADLRVAAPADAGSPTPLGQGARYAALPSVSAVSPVLRDTVDVGGQTATLLAVDSAKAADVVRMRPDLGRSELHAAARTLTAKRPRIPAVTLPGKPAQLSADIEVRGPRPTASTSTDFVVRAIVADSLGARHDIPLGRILPGTGKQGRTADLSKTAGPDGMIAYPLTLRGFRYDYVGGPGGGDFELTVSQVRTGTSGTALRTPAGTGWTGVFEIVRSADEVESGIPDFREAGDFLKVLLPRPASGPPDGLTAGSSAGPGDFPSGSFAGQLGAEQTAPIPGVITADLAKKNRLSVGELVKVGTFRVAVAAIVEALPTAGRTAVLLDWHTVTERSLLASGDAAPDEWWLAVRDDGAARALAAHPRWAASVTDRTAVRDALRDAPLGSGPQGALLFSFVAALAFAVIGFAVNAAVSARERAGELAVLRALGARQRQIFGLLGVEQAFLAGFGLVCGTLAGLVVARLAVPHLVLTEQAVAPYPEVVLATPLRPILLLIAVVMALLAAVMATGVPAARRRGLGAGVTLGEDA